MSDELPNNAASSGLNCPKCNYAIKLSLEDLLYKKSIRCPSCWTEFSMDRQSRPSPPEDKDASKE